MSMSETNYQTEAGREMRPAEVEVRVWDPLVRIVHWSLVLGYTIAWVTADKWDRTHEVAGYTVLGLVLVRVVWGFIGTRYAQFTDFVYRPQTVAAFLLDSISFRAKRYLGHNPAGGVMVLALLFCLLALAVTGFMMTTNRFWGVGWVEELHEGLANASLALVLLHIAGVILASIEHGENLVKSMISGKKRPLDR